jgi:tRNA dimethylallyltransferase
MGQEEPLTGFNVLKFGLAPARDLLYQRINQRVEKMFDSGLLDETRRLLKAGYDESCKGFEALGYRYAIQVLKGSMDERKAIELTQRDSRRYAKRQMTWFRREKDVCWIDLSGDSPEAFAQVYGIVRKHLPGSS